MIEDSLNQIAMIGPMMERLYDTAEKVRVAVTKYPMRHLEDFKNKSAEVFEKEFPGICKKFNDIVDTLQKPDLTMEEVKHCRKEMREIKEIIDKHK